MFHVLTCVEIFVSQVYPLSGVGGDVGAQDLRQSLSQSTSHFPVSQHRVGWKGKNEIFLLC